LSKVWDTSRFVPGAVQMQADIFRAGHGAAKITVHARDTYEAGINGSRDSERDELMEARKLTSKENEAYEYSFSRFIPTNFPIVPTRLVIAQWKQYCPEGGNCSDDSPVVPSDMFPVRSKLPIRSAPTKRRFMKQRRNFETNGSTSNFKSVSQPTRTGESKRG
jgi:hypothetical protein